METLIRKKIMDFLNTNHLFSSKQFGFIKCRSTVLQLLNVYNDWSNLLEDKEQIDIIYTDLETAYDKVPHKRVLSKLQPYGINHRLIG